MLVAIMHWIAKKNEFRVRFPALELELEKLEFSSSEFFIKFIRLDIEFQHIFYEKFELFILK